MTPGLLGQLVDWSWIGAHLTGGDASTPSIRSLLVQHIALTVIAVAIGTAISIPLGILSYRRHAVYVPVTFVSGILYTIPSLALFILLIPITGLSFLTVEIGLVSYTLLILVRNVVAGLAAVPADVKDAATGMGMRPRQLLWQVELPLATPVIMAGVRVATVSTIGLVTIGSLIGKGGLGMYIRGGLQTFFDTEILVGAVLSLLLALVADALLVGIERLLTPWTRRSDRRTRRRGRRELVGVAGGR
ncbi:MAG TPA: ABC transporter permease [Actinomycetota bacterium]|nr:ABC transporter permease [Actinomycetota bacterium]